MFGFLNDIFEKSELTKDVLQFKVVMLSNRLLYVQGFKTILLVEQEKIVLKVDKGELDISGEGLTIKELNNCAMSIKGKIVNVEVCER